MEILIRSKEEDTGIVYTYLISREEAEQIVEERSAYIEIDGGYVMFSGEKVVIKKQGAPASLNKQEVIRQIEDQL